MDNIHFSGGVIAHRGASGYAPENTLAAFTKAAMLGCKWVEFDVILTKDQEPIIFHDHILDRTTNGRGLINQHSYSYLRTLDAGSWFDLIYSGEKIPTLQQALLHLQNLKLAANIELKADIGSERDLAQAVWRQCQHIKNMPIVFSSFSTIALKEMRQLAPRAHLSLLLEEWLSDWTVISKELNCLAIHADNQIITPSMAKKVLSMRKKLLSYTVNDPARAKVLYSWGVEAIFSDFPDRFAEKVA